MDPTIAVYVAYVALAGVLISAAVSLINGILTNRFNRQNISWQKEQWIKNKKQEVFFGCLKCLGESMPLPMDYNGNPVPVQQLQSLQPYYIDNGRLLGIMQSLQYAGSWLSMVEGYCSNDVNALGVKNHREKFLECLNLVFQATPGPIGTGAMARIDYGLSEAHQEAYEYVMELAAIELLIGKVPTLPNAEG